MGAFKMYTIYLIKKGKDVSILIKQKEEEEKILNYY